VNVHVHVHVHVHDVRLCCPGVPACPRVRSSEGTGIVDDDRWRCESVGVSRTRRLVLLVVLGSVGVAYGTGVMLMRGARATLAESGCDDDVGEPPGEAVWIAISRLEMLARLPGLARDAGDAREHALWRCRGAVERVCMEARWNAERRARQAIRDERDARSAGIRHETGHRRSLPDADSAAIDRWEREQERALTVWEREAEQAPDWRPYLGPEVPSTCDAWAPTIAELERRQHGPSCSPCE
jgi:hypothetical protein